MALTGRAALAALGGAPVSKPGQKAAAGAWP